MGTPAGVCITCSLGGLWFGEYWFDSSFPSSLHTNLSEYLTSMQHIRSELYLWLTLLFDFCTLVFVVSLSRSWHACSCCSARPVQQKLRKEQKHHESVWSHWLSEAHHHLCRISMEYFILLLNWIILLYCSKLMVFLSVLDLCCSVVSEPLLCFIVCSQCSFIHWGETVMSSSPSNGVMQDSLISCGKLRNMMLWTKVFIESKWTSRCFISMTCWCFWERNNDLRRVSSGFKSNSDALISCYSPDHDCAETIHTLQD